MLETVKYVRKPLFVQTAEVTLDNFDDVAEWTGGDIQEDKSGKKFVRVPVKRPGNDRQTKAYVGDFVLYAKTGFKVFLRKAFLDTFDRVDDGTTVVATGDEVDGEPRTSVAPLTSEEIKNNSLMR